MSDPQENSVDIAARKMRSWWHVLVSFVTIAVGLGVGHFRVELLEQRQSATDATVDMLTVDRAVMNTRIAQLEMQANESKAEIKELASQVASIDKKTTAICAALRARCD